MIAVFVNCPKEMLQASLELAAVEAHLFLTSSTLIPQIKYIHPSNKFRTDLIG